MNSRLFLCSPISMMKRSSLTFCLSFARESPAFSEPGQSSINMIISYASWWLSRTHVTERCHGCWWPGFWLALILELLAISRCSCVSPRSVEARLGCPTYRGSVPISTVPWNFPSASAHRALLSRKGFPKMSSLIILDPAQTWLCAEKSLVVSEDGLVEAFNIRGRRRWRETRTQRILNAE